MAIIAAIVRAVGLPACIIALLLVYYEGLPGASRIPFLTSIPVIGDLTTGRVHSFAADEVRRATKGLVDKAEIAALEARLARERALRHAADQAAEEARKRKEEEDRREDWKPYSAFAKRRPVAGTTSKKEQEACRASKQRERYERRKEKEKEAKEAKARAGERF